MHDHYTEFDLKIQVDKDELCKYLALFLLQESVFFDLFLLQQARVDLRG